MKKMQMAIGVQVHASWSCTPSESTWRPRTSKMKWRSNREELKQIVTRISRITHVDQVPEKLSCLRSAWRTFRHKTRKIGCFIFGRSLFRKLRELWHWSTSKSTRTTKSLSRASTRSKTSTLKKRRKRTSWLMRKNKSDCWRRKSKKPAVWSFRRRTSPRWRGTCMLWCCCSTLRSLCPTKSASSTPPLASTSSWIALLTHPSLLISSLLSSLLSMMERETLSLIRKILHVAIFLVGLPLTLSLQSRSNLLKSL